MLLSRFHCDFCWEFGNIGWVFYNGIYKEKAALDTMISFFQVKRLFCYFVFEIELCWEFKYFSALSLEFYFCNVLLACSLSLWQNNCAQKFVFKKLNKRFPLVAVICLVINIPQKIISKLWGGEKEWILFTWHGEDYDCGSTSVIIEASWILGFQ